MSVANSTNLVMEAIARKEGDVWREFKRNETIPFFIGVSGALVGRQLDSKDDRGQIMLQDDTLMSRTHAEFKYDFAEKSFSLRDLGSSNNTVIVSGYLMKNNQKIAIENRAIGLGPGKPSPWFRLAVDFVFQIGGTRFRVLSLSIADETEFQEENDNPYQSLKQSGNSFAVAGGGWPKPEIQSAAPPRGNQDQMNAILKDAEPKRVPIFVKSSSNLRSCGALMLRPQQTFIDIQQIIFSTLLSPDELKSCPGAESLQLIINGKVSVKATEMRESAYTVLGKTDQLVASIGTR